MDKELLVKVRLTAEQIEAVLKAHKETISGNFIIKHRFDEVNNELKSAKAQVEEGLKQIGDFCGVNGQWDKVILKKLFL